MSKVIDITSVDKNMFAETSIKEPNVCFYDVKKPPFSLHGLCSGEGEPTEFHRMPVKVAEATSSGVAWLNYHTAGGRVRFSTNSKYVGIRACMKRLHLMNHMAPTGSSGFDLYDGVHFAGIFRPTLKSDATQFEGIVRFDEAKMRDITINFPLYNDVTELYIALDGEAELSEAPKYKLDLPIVYYGHSITQGGCASRPGNATQAIVSRAIDADFINLGFSGSGCGEEAVVDYMATLDMSLFFSDYDANSPSVEHLRSTHFRMYERIRAKHPTVPYIMMTRTSGGLSEAQIAARRAVIWESYERALALGDKNVYFIDGGKIFTGIRGEACTVDGDHPNDLGFMTIAETVLPVIKEALGIG